MYSLLNCSSCSFLFTIIAVSASTQGTLHQLPKIQWTISQHAVALIKVYISKRGSEDKKIENVFSLIASVNHDIQSTSTITDFVVKIPPSDPKTSFSHKEWIMDKLE